MIPNFHWCHWPTATHWLSAYLNRNSDLAIMIMSSTQRVTAVFMTFSSLRSNISVALTWVTLRPFACQWSALIKPWREHRRRREVLSRQGGAQRPPGHRSQWVSLSRRGFRFCDSPVSHKDVQQRTKSGTFKTADFQIAGRAFDAFCLKATRRRSHYIFAHKGVSVLELRLWESSDCLVGPHRGIFPDWTIF